MPASGPATSTPVRRTTTGKGGEAAPDNKTTLVMRRGEPAPRASPVAAPEPAVRCCSCCFVCGEPLVAWCILFEEAPTPSGSQPISVSDRELSEVLRLRLRFFEEQSSGKLDSEMGRKTTCSKTPSRGSAGGRLLGGEEDEDMEPASSGGRGNTRCIGRASGSSSFNKLPALRERLLVGDSGSSVGSGNFSGGPRRCVQRFRRPSLVPSTSDCPSPQKAAAHTTSPVPTGAKRWCNSRARPRPRPLPRRGSPATPQTRQIDNSFAADNSHTPSGEKDTALIPTWAPLRSSPSLAQGGSRTARSAASSPRRQTQIAWSRPPEAKRGS
mmetsp:Transcript_59316/g.170365  ORF Transcript_59316/g.170365 Transcript_59316/m.170365 type:complete len:326 (+) Transcript_59316:398-1375(+)